MSALKTQDHNSGYENIAGKSVRGAFWVFGSFGFGKVLGFIQTIILVRMLEPTDFGLMAIAGFATALMNVFTQTGINVALIHRQENVDRAADAAWVISLLRGLVLFIAIFLCAGLAARFFENPEVRPILRLVSISFLVGGTGSMGSVLIRKEMNFKRRAVFFQMADVLSIATTVGLAFILRSVWALAWGRLATSVFTVTASYLMHPWRPRLRVDWRLAAELFKYGKHVLAAGVIIFFLTQGDDAFVGKMLGASALGFYTLAYGLSNLPATCISHVISQVTFPAYSKIQNDRKRLSEAYRTVLSLVSLAAFPIAAGIAFLGNDIVRVVYGPKWLPMVPSMQVLCLFGLFRCFGGTMGQIFYAVGRPQVLSKLAAAQLVILCAVIYPLTSALGILGTSIATTVAEVPVIVWGGTKVASILQLDVRKVIQPLAYPVLGTVFMAVSLAAMKILLPGAWTTAVLIGAILGAAMLYAGVILLIRGTAVSEISRLALSLKRG